MLKFFEWKNRENAEQSVLSALLGHSAPQEGEILLAAADGEQLIGIIGLQSALSKEMPYCAVLCRIAVLPAYRRQGIGRILLGMAAERASSLGARFLAAPIPQTTEGKAFAAAAGMAETENFPGILLLDLTDVEGLRHG